MKLKNFCYVDTVNKVYLIFGLLMIVLILFKLPHYLYSAIVTNENIVYSFQYLLYIIMVFVCIILLTKIYMKYRDYLDFSNIFRYILLGVILISTRENTLILLNTVLMGMIGFFLGKLCNLLEKGVNFFSRNQTILKLKIINRVYYLNITLMVVFLFFLFSIRNQLVINLINSVYNDYFVLFFVSYIVFNLWTLAIGFTVSIACNFKIDIKLTDLDFHDLITSKIYYEYESFKGKRINRIMRFKLHNVEDTINYNISNQLFSKTTLYEQKSQDYVYFCLNDNALEIKKLDIILTIDGKIYKMRLYLKIEKKEDELIVSNYKVTSCRKILCKKFVRDGVEEQLTPQETLSTLKYCYKYNYKYEISEELKLKSKQTSSWLFHNGSYGSGKSSLDLLSVLESNYKPVIISPWENNYDVDFLYLIYQKTKACCKDEWSISNILLSMFHRIKRPTNIIFNTTIFSISILIYEFFGEFIAHLLTLGYELLKDDKMIIDIKGYTEKIIGHLDGVSLKDSLPLFSFIIILCIVWIIVKFFLAEIIIYFKDSTKIHQFYYIDRILNMIKDYNIFLIIEDVDRMPKEGIEDVLRVCSCLNREYSNRTRPLGIISMDEKTLVNSNKLSQQEFDDMRNKVFIKEIFKEYDDKKSMLIYLKNFCDIAYKIFSTAENRNEKQIEVLKFLNSCKLKERSIIGNFRDLHKMFDTLIFYESNIETLKEDVEKVIKVPLKDVCRFNRLFRS